MAKGKKNEDAKPEVTDGEAPAEATAEATAEEAPTLQPAEAKSAAQPEAPPPDVEPPPTPQEPWPDATPDPRKPVPAGRARAETIGMPIDLGVGAPPELPKAGSVEDPTFMPGPRDVPGGGPDDPGTAPGRVPPGDSRSLRRGTDFALVYRTGSAVISRFGAVGTRGQWRVVEYPTSASASNAYAKECSRFVADGFSDYRD